ncbi:MAG TPA: penicillin-binding transpeptidase domain-containing protein [Bacillota bacterium]|nr:penicillin-binding transpeptidase domain-containing protein [Bacillota bacterium]
MKQFLRNLKMTTTLLVLFVAVLLIALFVQQKRSTEELSAAAGENKYTLQQIYSRAGSISSSDGVVLAHSDEGERKYAENSELARACLHLVGDYTHRLTNSVESVYMQELLGSSRSFLEQLKLDLSGCGFEGNDLTLTVNSNLMLKAGKLLKNYRGSIVLLNYETGDLLALANSPTVYPQDVINWENITDGSLFNRALYGRYLPGSTIKMITTAALLEAPDLDIDMKVKCLGSKEIVPAGARETLTPEGHGTVGLQEAFRKSCNAFFGKLAIALGRGRFTEKAEDFGFNQDLVLGNFKIAQSRLDLQEPGQGALSWAGVGQPIGQDKVTVSPMHLAAIAGAIANDGVMMKPNVLLQETDPLGAVKYSREAEEYYSCSRPDTAAELEELVLDVVNSGTGKRARRDGLKIAGKTGTAEMTNEDGKIEVNSLFAGYLISDSHPLAVAVVLEGENRDAATIAADMLQYAASIAIP